MLGRGEQPFFSFFLVVLSPLRYGIYLGTYVCFVDVVVRGRTSSLSGRFLGAVLDTGVLSCSLF